MKQRPVPPIAFPNLDPGIDRLLEILGKGNPTPPREPSPTAIAHMREAASQVRRTWAESVSAGPIRRHVVETSNGPVSLTIHLPNGISPGGTLLFLHGGGWTLFDSETHSPLMRALAAKTGWAVVGVDTPRAPESPYPEPVEASASVTRTVMRTGPGLGLPEPLALCGDSSGANLAVAATLVMRDADETLPAALVLFYGVYDSDLSRQSYAKFGTESFPLSAEKMAWFWDRYCPDVARRSEPLASPLHADLSGLPPTNMVVAGQDILRDENLAMAARLAEAGVRVSLDVYPGAVHAFCEAVGFVDVSRRAVARSATWLLDVVGASSAPRGALP
jgi:acetyl esterase